MNDKNILFNREKIATILAILAIFALSASVACARRTKSDVEPPSDYHENAIRRFEVVSLVSLPFTAIHSYLVFIGVEMIRQREFSPEISDNDYYIIGGMAVTFSAFIGFWDWYHTRGEDTSQPKIPTRKAGIAQNLDSRNELLNANEHLNRDRNLFSDSVLVVQLYQIKF